MLRVAGSFAALRIDRKNKRWQQDRRRQESATQGGGGKLVDEPTRMASIRRVLLDWFDPRGGFADHLIARWLFLRALGVIYFSAFFALVYQVRGLIGRQGILPAAEFLRSLHGWGGCGSGTRRRCCGSRGAMRADDADAGRG